MSADRDCMCLRMTNPLREALRPIARNGGWLRGSLWTKSVEMLWMINVFFMEKKYQAVFSVYTGRYCHWDGWILISICQFIEVFSSNIHAYTSISI